MKQYIGFSILIFLCLSMLTLSYIAYLKPYPPIFLSLQDIQKYAAHMEEYPHNESFAWAMPSYATFWRQQKYVFRQLFLYKLGLKSWPVWHPYGFNRLLVKMININENNGYTGRFSLKMKPVPGSVFVIWGDIQGAFHSLVRGLTELQKKGFINDSLQIIKPYTYFVFNGQLIDRGPYSLEALTVVMRLMERNPQHIFYIRGRDEDTGHWKNFNLKEELIIRLGAFSKKDIPLGNELERFFNTLPLALYLIDKEEGDKVDLMRISNYDRSSVELNEDNFSSFFKEPTGVELSIIKLTGKPEGDSKKKINVRAIIKGESRASVYRPTPGLVQLEADKGAMAWTMISSPTESYRHLQDFYFDAFVILDIGKKMSNWTLSLYDQDVRELLGFRLFAIYNLLTGLHEYQKEKVEQGVDVFSNLQRESVALDEEIASLRASCSGVKKE